MIICFLDELDKDCHPNFANNKLEKKSILHKLGSTNAG